VDDVFTAPVLVTLRRLLCFFPGRGWWLNHSPQSPWLLVHFAPAWGEEATPANGKQNFAIWLVTAAAYEIRGEAVEDDPIPLERLDPERDLIGVQ
jgi:hypothetical protein